MEIVLLRHGRPDFAFKQWITMGQLGVAVERYNHAGVTESPPAATMDMAQACDYIVCSDLPRSLQSARLLGVDRIDLSHPRFREVGLPTSDWPSPRLPPHYWFAFSRLLWFAGHSRGTESRAMARLRAMEAMQTLGQLAQTHGRILFVGHGLLNQFIATQLLTRGWLGPKRAGRGYWGYGLYRSGH